MFGLIVRFFCKDEEAAAGFDELVAVTAQGVRNDEPGSLVYVSHLVEGQPLQRIFYEVYVDREAFDLHEQQPHTRRFLEQRDQFLAGHEVEVVTPIVVKGIDS